MSTKTGWLKDKNGKKFAPKTLSSRVIMSNGTNLQDTLDNLETGGSAEIKLVEGETETIIDEMVINKFDSKADYEAALENDEIADNEFCSFPEEDFVNKGMLTADDDLNNIFEPGIYQYETASIPQNCPFANAGIIEVIKSHSKYIQRVTRYGTAGQSAERVYYKNWLAWVTKCAPVSLDKSVMYTVKAANTYELVTSITIPANCFYAFSASASWNNSKGTGVYISSSNTNYAASANWAETTVNENNHGKSATAIGKTGNTAWTCYLWGRWSGVSSNPLTISGFYIPSV